MVVVLHVEGEIPERPSNYPECGGDWPTPRASDGEGKKTFHRVTQIE